MADYLLDTNFILRLINTLDARSALTLKVTETLIGRGDNPVVTPQVLIEFWSAASRPVAANGFGWDLDRVAQEIRAISAKFQILPDLPAIYPRWVELVSGGQVRGKQVHDARLVAVMLAHGVHHLITFNVKDFQRFGQIEAIHPDAIAGP